MPLRQEQITCQQYQETGFRNLAGEHREEQYPEAAEALCRLAEGHAQQDPIFRTPLAFTRLTVAAACEALRAEGFPEEQVPAAGTMARILNRLGYRLRKVLKAKPQKKIKATDANFENIKTWIFIQLIRVPKIGQDFSLSYCFF
jgi:hypothetical protein